MLLHAKERQALYCAPARKKSDKHFIVLLHANERQALYCAPARKKSGKHFIVLLHAKRAASTLLCSPAHMLD